MASPFIGALKYLPSEDDGNHSKTQQKTQASFMKPKDVLIDAINNTKSQKDKKIEQEKAQQQQ